MNHVATTYFISVRKSHQQFKENNDDNIDSLKIEADKMMPYLTDEIDLTVSVITLSESKYDTFDKRSSSMSDRRTILVLNKDLKN